MAPKARTTRSPASQTNTRPGRSAPGAEALLRAQRLGLALAMVDAVAEKGYRATTVADVVARAGVSRRTFYDHFANKEDCLLVTFDLVADEAMRRVEQAYEGAQGWPANVEAAIRALFESAIENPGAMRLSLLEIGSVGPAGIERREASMLRYERFLSGALELAPGPGTVSSTVLKAVIGGINGVLYRRVLRGERAELLELVPDLTSWAISYYPTPPTLLARRRRDSAVERPRQRPSQLLRGGRAPGTLAPHASLTPRRGLPRGDQNISRSWVVHSQRERILDAVANLTAAEGYAELKVEDVAEQAAVSLQAFYEHFVDKEDAFLVAYEVGHSKALAMAERAYAAETDWRASVRAGIAVLFEFLAAEPSFAHIALVDALVATDRAAARSNVGVDAFARMLVPGLEEAPGQSAIRPVIVEAIAGGIFDLCLHYALHDRISELPELTELATYIALASFLGSAEAAQVALGG